MEVLLAPGAFRGVTTPVAAAQAIGKGWRSASAARVREMPLSDGSIGLLEVYSAARGGSLEGAAVPGPHGEPLPASVLVSRSAVGTTTVLIEADQVIGAGLYSTAHRRAAAVSGSSAGLGHLIRLAVEAGAHRIVIGLGPAAVHDVGAGLIAVLAGAEAPELRGGAAGLGGVRADHLVGLGAARGFLAGCEVLVACSESRPLLGLDGATAALRARAGLTDGEAQDVERSVARFAAELERWLPRASSTAALPLADSAGVARLGRRPLSGAGGGVATALAALGGRLFDGAQVIAALLDLDGAAREADLLVTGAGRLDADSLGAGVVAAVAEAGIKAGVPVIALAPTVDVARRELARFGIVGAYAVDPEPGPFGGPDPKAPDAERLLALAARLAVTWSGRRP